MSLGVVLSWSSKAGESTGVVLFRFGVSEELLHAVAFTTTVLSFSKEMRDALCLVASFSFSFFLCSEREVLPYHVASRPKVY